MIKEIIKNNRTLIKGYNTVLSALWINTSGTKNKGRKPIIIGIINRYVQELISITLNSTNTLNNKAYTEEIIIP